jgi:hypothetical protein
MDNIENIESPVGVEGATSSQDTDSQVDTQPSETVESVSDAETAEEVALLAGKYKTPEELEKGYKELESKLGERSEHSELTKMLEDQTGMSASQIRDYIAQQNELKLQQQYAQNPTPILAREIQQLKSQLALQAEEKELDKFLEKNPEYSNFKEEIQEYAFMPKYQGMSYEDIAKEKIGKIIARGQETAYKKIDTKKQTQATGVSQAPPRGKITLDDMKNMTSAEMEAFLPRADISHRPY